MKSKHVWLITGASKGLGLSLVKELLKQGYNVAATSRNRQALLEAIGEHSNLFALELDLTQDQDVRHGIDRIIKKFGQLDVVVNNAGYSQIGTLEELSDDEARKNFDVNVFGSLNIIRNVSPIFREQGSGHFFNISSIGGVSGSFPGFGIYCASKFAVAGFTEALAVEMEPFGVKTTLVYPGYFRTSFLSKDSVQVARNPIAAYERARASESEHLNQIHGNQNNDPEKAAKLFIEISRLAHPPMHLFMGEDAYKLVQNKINLLQIETEKWKSYSFSTDYSYNSSLPLNE